MHADEGRSPGRGSGTVAELTEVVAAPTTHSVRKCRTSSSRAYEEVASTGDARDGTRNGRHLDIQARAELAAAVRAPARDTARRIARTEERLTGADLRDVRETLHRAHRPAVVIIVDAVSRDQIAPAGDAATPAQGARGRARDGDRDGVVDAANQGQALLLADACHGASRTGDTRHLGAHIEVGIRRDAADQPRTGPLLEFLALLLGPIRLIDVAIVAPDRGPRGRPRRRIRWTCAPHRSSTPRRRSSPRTRRVRSRRREASARDARDASRLARRRPNSEATYRSQSRTRHRW